MTFKGSCKTDLEQILSAFPKNFTAKIVEDQFSWTTARVRQAITFGQQNDFIRMISQPKIHGSNNDRRVEFSVYENLRWRKEWVTKAWRTHGEMASQEQTAG